MARRPSAVRRSRLADNPSPRVFLSPRFLVDPRESLLWLSGNRIARALAVALLLEALTWASLAQGMADFGSSHPFEFSGSIVKQVNGKKYQAQVFAKHDRLRLEYKYAIRTEYGYAAIEIIRLDKNEAWYLLAQQKELLITPLDPD